MTDTLLLACGPIEIQASADGTTKAPRITILAYGGGTMRVSGFGEVAIDLKGADVSGDVPLLADHGEGLDAIVGQGKARIDAGRILVEGTLTTATAAGEKVVALARSGITLQASIGFLPEKRESIRAREQVSLNGRMLTAGESGLTVIRSGRLREVSILPVGADSGTQVAISAKGAKMETTTTQDVTARERIEAVWNQATFHDGNLRAKAHTEMLRAVAGEVDVVAFERDLLASQLNDEKLHAIRSERPTGPAIHSSSRDTSPDVLEAAFCRTAGLRDMEKAFKPEVLEASDRFRGIGLQELLLHAANANGWQGGRHRVTSGNLREVLMYAMPAKGIQAAGVPSYADVAGILSGGANKILLEGFTAVEQTYAAISRPRPVSDFKETTCYRLTAEVEYEELPPAGLIKHGTMGQESYTVQAKTYAKLLVLSRTQIVNDDLGAFDDLRNRLGRGAGLALNRVFWTKFLDDAAFFTAARANLITGTVSALADAGTSLDVANQAFVGMVDAEGGPTGVAPRLLLHPAAIGATAKRLYVSGEIRDTTASTKALTANIWQNRFLPLESAYLSNASIAGSSATAWYLLANPADLPVVEIAYLDGQTAPTIESADTDFDTLGIQFRGFHDFGVSLANWRAGVKSTGAAP